ncbi:MAG: hypothetical protein JXB39_10085 [Deltaproteobacteria bacterium]|nr:hypothetical protein [Deltaproteobacteria bacterium]
MWKKWLERGLLVAGYLVLAVGITWPLALHPTTSLLGYPSVDGLDTVHLRGSLAGLFRHPAGFTSMAAYWPAGFEPLSLAPNLLDHLLAAPLVLLLPFPLADNLWWILVLAANGLAGHHLGRRLGGGHGSGALVGVAWATAECVLREANLHHAPQALAPFAPLYLAALLDALDKGGRKAGCRAGLWFALASLGYWYMGLFLAAGSLGILVLRRSRIRVLVPGALLAAVLVAPALVPWLACWEDLPIAARPAGAVAHVTAPELDLVPAERRMAALHGADPFFPFRASPVDRSNRVGVVLIAAAVLGARRFPGGTRWGLVVLAATGAVFVLGPVLKFGETPVIVAGRTVPLPFAWLSALGPWMARLDWPERWGCLVALGAAALAARAPRPWILAGLLLLETVLLSGNLPLARQDLHLLEGWRALERADGAVLELPLSRWGLDASIVGLHGRYHGRPSANPMLLPPGTTAPLAWREWTARQPFVQWLQRYEDRQLVEDPQEDLAASLASSGIGAVALDAEPQGVLTEGRVRSYRRRLVRILGPPDDYGAVIVWWTRPARGGAPPTVFDGDEWRARASRWRQLHAEPERNTLIRSYRQVLEEGAPTPATP